MTARPKGIDDMEYIATYNTRTKYTYRTGAGGLILPMTKEYPPYSLPATDSTLAPAVDPVMNLPTELADTIFKYVLSLEVLVKEKVQVPGESALTIDITSTGRRNLQNYQSFPVLSCVGVVSKSWRAFVKRHLYDLSEWQFEKANFVKKLFNPLECRHLSSRPRKVAQPLLYPEQNNHLLFENLKPTVFRIRRIRLLNAQILNLKIALKHLRPLDNLCRISIDRNMLQKLLSKTKGYFSTYLSDDRIDPRFKDDMPLLSYDYPVLMISQDSPDLKRLCDGLFETWEILLGKHKDEDIRDRIFRVDVGRSLFFVKIPTRHGWVSQLPGVEEYVQLYKRLSLPQYVREELKKRADASREIALKEKLPALVRKLKKLQRDFEVIKRSQELYSKHLSSIEEKHEICRDSINALLARLREFKHLFGLENHPAPQQPLAPKRKHHDTSLSQQVKRTKKTVDSGAAHVPAAIPAHSAVSSTYPASSAHFSHPFTNDAINSFNTEQQMALASGNHFFSPGNAAFATGDATFTPANTPAFAPLQQFTFRQNPPALTRALDNVPITGPFIDSFGGGQGIPNAIPDFVQQNTAGFFADQQSTQPQYHQTQHPPTTSQASGQATDFFWPIDPALNNTNYNLAANMPYTSGPVVPPAPFPAYNHIHERMNGNAFDTAGYAHNRFGNSTSYTRNNGEKE